MQLFHTVDDLQRYLHQQRSAHPSELSVGFVPTMGALHAGHLSLIERSRQQNTLLVVSIFVNPLQFGPTEDLDRYPRPTEADRTLCEKAGVDSLFMPTVQSLYGTKVPNLGQLSQIIPPSRLTNTLCGKSRPTHFQGVATVVTKLLNIVRPTRAYFGQKDAQQVAIIKQVQADLNLPGQIHICPIVRESDGLALSSRNRYLSPGERKQATVLSRSLRAAQKALIKGEYSASKLLHIARAVIETEPSVRLDYLALVDPDTLETLTEVDSVGMMAIAAHIGTPEKSTRLIDNILLTRRPPIVAIDGPAGAGKSTVARQVAHQLGLLYLDTGAMYRALTWYVLSQDVHPGNSIAVAALLPQCQIQLIARGERNNPMPPQVKVNDRDVTDAIRSAEVTAQVSTIAAQPAVRAKLVEQQQQYGREGGVVADGRDIGTHVYPHAELKIYLTASVEERARRRYKDLQTSQQPLPSMADLTELIAERDRKDSTRAVSPLRKADDALEIITDNLSADDVVDKITTLYQQLLV